MKRKMTIRITLLFLVIFTNASAQSNSQNSSNLSLSAFFTTNYIWRDIVTDYSAIQASASYAYGNTGFALNFWSSYGTKGKSNDLEISTTISYTKSFGKLLNAYVGWVYYLAPILESTEGYVYDTNFSESFLGINSSVFLQPSIALFRDNNNTFYSNISLTKNISFGGQTIAAVNTSLGYRFNHEVDAENGWRDLNMSLYIPLRTKEMTIVFVSSHTWVLDANIAAYQFGVNLVFNN